MARSKPKSSTGIALKAEKANATQAAELILVDFRISKVVAERFRAPEDARKGTYKLSSETDKVILSEDQADRTGVISLNLDVVGNTQSEDADKASVKSFAIHIEAEGRFEMHGNIDVNDETQCGALLVPIITLMHGLCVHTARAEADSMGYRSVRPAYQPRNRPKPILEAVEK